MPWQRSLLDLWIGIFYPITYGQVNFDFDLLQTDQERKVVRLFLTLALVRYLVALSKVVTHYNSQLLCSNNFSLLFDKALMSDNPV